MSKSQQEYTKRKRLRSHLVKSPEKTTKKEFIINNENEKYYFQIYLDKEENQILLKSGQGKNDEKFEIILDLVSLKQISRLFMACYTIDEAYKIILNLFKNKKVVIQEEIKDSLVLIFVVINLIEDREEEVQLILKKNKENLKNDDNLDESKEKKNKNNSQKENKVENENNDNINNSQYLDFEQKINILFQNNQTKDIQLCRIEKNFEEIKLFHINLKKETNNIKKAAGFNSANIKEESQESMNKYLEQNYIIDNKEMKEEKEEEKAEDNLNEEEQKDQEDQEEKEDEKKDKKRGKSNQKLPKNKIIKIKEFNNKIPKEENKAKNIPKMVFVKNLTKRATFKYLGDNNFVIFKTIDDQLLLAYGTQYLSIHFYDLEIDKVTKRIANAHEYEITNFRYTLDKVKNRDLLLTICNYVKSLKVWNVEDGSCILNINNIYTSGELYSSCFLMDEIHSKNYIISVNSEKENLKIFDFNGKKINEINNSGDRCFLVDSFYNSKSKKYFIVVGNEKFIVSYNFPERTVFHKYCENKSTSCHINFIISTKDKEVKLIESDYFGYIRIWDFNKGELLKKIFLEKRKKVRAICLWSYKYLFVGADDKKIKLLDLESNYEIDNLKVNDYIFILKKVESKKLGECLILQGKIDNGKIKKWRNENSK